MHVLRRSVIVLLLGLLVNGFPDYALRTMRLPGITPGIGVTFDPEGLLSTLPAIATTLMGRLCWRTAASYGHAA